MDTMLNMTQQCALAIKNAISHLDYIRQSIASKLSEKILPLHSALVRHVRGVCPVLVSPVQERHGCTGASLMKGDKDG